MDEDAETLLIQLVGLNVTLVTNEIEKWCYTLDKEESLQKK